MRKTMVAVLFAAALAAVPVRAADNADDETAALKKATELLSAGKQSDAEELVFTRAKEHPSVKSAYYAAVLIRSRFDLPQADQVFEQVTTADPNGTEGQVAKLVVAIDHQQDVEANFTALDKLASDHPDDPLVLWMVAVECRTLHKTDVGVERYTKLLKTFDPGPALVHQTLGNLYMEQRKPDEALKQYDLAIKMEPAAWDYNTRGNALVELGRLDDADAAYKKATELDADDYLSWSNWARLCTKRGDDAGAAEKQAKADAIRAKQ